VSILLLGYRQVDRNLEYSFHVTAIFTTDRITELFRHNAVQCGWASATSRFIDLEERFERLVDANDMMLESVVSVLRKKTSKYNFYYF